MKIIDELAAYDKTLTNTEKVVKLIPSLLGCCKRLQIVSSMTNISFDHFFTSVQAEITHRKNYEWPHSDTDK